MTNDRARTRTGLLLGLGAYLIWGVLPIYFKVLSAVPATELVAHRIVWSLLLLAALATGWKRWRAIAAAIRVPRIALTLALTAVLIAMNWLIYIWAVISGQVIAGSLGYYLNPLANVLFGVIFLKERLSRGQAAAVTLAGLGVAALAIGASDGLWISLTIAASFASYGILRKIAPVEALDGLAIETAILVPVALGWLLWLEAAGASHFTGDDFISLLLLLSGIVTALPLLMFTAASKRLPYSTLGFLQYIAPSIQFLIAVLLFDEKLTSAHLICFGAIWTALAIFLWEGVRLGRVAARDRAVDASAQA